MAKMQILFDGFENLAYAIDEAEKDLHAAVDEALTETAEIVKANLTPAAAVYGAKGRKGYATGKMLESMIKDTRIDWSGMVAEVGVGFSTNNYTTYVGFMHSIFVMYGTPRYKKDQKIYNAIRGTKVKKEIAAKQEEVMQKHLQLGGE